MGQIKEIKAGHLKTSGHISDSATISVKVNLSYLHIKSAKLFVDRCLSIEAEESNQEGLQPRRNELKSYCSAAIMMAVAYLEANINHFYLLAIDKSQRLLSSISEKDIDCLFYGMKQSALKY